MYTEQKAENIKVVYVPITELHSSEYNPRKWDAEAKKHLKESITRFGVVDPLLVNGADGRKNIVIGGHFRLEAIKELGHTEAPVVYLTIPDIERERELNIRFNNCNVLAAGLGFEPRYTDPESVVLPLDDPAIYKTRLRALYTISHFLFLLYPPLLFLKQSMHFKFDVSRGVKGSEVIVAPHPLHVQFPSTRGRSPSARFGELLPCLLR